MTRIAAAVGTRVRLSAANTVDAMLTDSGVSVSSLAWTDDALDLSLGAAHAPWETNLHPAPDARIARRGALTVAADATLYRGAESAPDAGAATRILDAYARGGTAALRALDGDFAFVLWDAATRRLVAARDFVGRRSLFCATVGDSTLVASTVDAILRDERVPRTLDRAALAATAAGLWGHSHATAFAAIREIPAGQMLVIQPGESSALMPLWSAPEAIMRRAQPLDDAAAELRGLLEEAVRVRLAPLGPTSLSLSGGWDSSAVLGASVATLGASARERLRPVSISYPVGDPGREDELISSVTAHTGVPTRWLDVDTIQLFDDATARAGGRALPFAHAFEPWNRELARAARAEGANVMFDGAGGDQLFQVSDIYLSDLFGRGQWLELARQWRLRGGRGVRNFWRWAVRPALPLALVHGLARIRGLQPPRQHLERVPPPWFVSRFLETHGVMERERAAEPVRPRHSRVLGETHAYLRFPYFHRTLALVQGFSQDEGVELRSPLLDSRVVEFAVRRPWSERADGRETKVLLRRAMRGLLPEAFLAPRTRRTGVTSAYFLRQMRGPGRPLVETMLKESLLADLGMINLGGLRRAWEHVLAHDDDETGVRIFFTLQAELWLRGHRSAGT